MRLRTEKESLALLLAVVADIDAGFLLSAYDVVQRRASCRGELRIDRFAAILPQVETDQLHRSRQAAGMRGEDAGLAGLHDISLLLGWVSVALERLAQKM